MRRAAYESGFSHEHVGIVLGLEAALDLSHQPGE